MAKISQLIEQIVQYKQDSEVDLLSVDPTLIGGRTALRNSALQQYREGLEVLKGCIGQHAGAIFVSGPGAQAFAKIGEEEGPGIVLDASEVYRKVAECWFSTVRIDQVFAIDCLMSFLGGLYQLLAPLGIREVARPEFGKFFGSPVTTIDEATSLTRDILRSTLGDDLNGLYLNHRLAEEVVKQEWEFDVIPAIILNATADEINSETGLYKGVFYGHNIYHTAKTEEVPKSEVRQTFKRLHNKIKGAPEPKSYTTEYTDETVIINPTTETKQDNTSNKE